MFHFHNRKETPNDGNISYIVLYIMLLVGTAAVLYVVWEFFIPGRQMDGRTAKMFFDGIMYIAAAAVALFLVKGLLKMLGLDK